VAGKLKTISEELHTWSRDILGDLQNRIKKLKEELEECRRGEITAQNVAKEQRIRFKLERLEDQWEMSWRQRAHVNWLEKGDRNTSYFHSFANERKKHNHISRLKGGDGEVVEGEEGLQALVTNYFFNLFTPMAGSNADHVLDNIQPRVTPVMNEVLAAEFSREEIKAALDSIGDLKAPGPDGMPAVFYKRFWETVGDTVVEEVLNVLQGGSIPEGWNETIVVLIPKVQTPQSMKDLRPISLCNVVYKLVSKVLANRLKCILNEIISPNQSAFVPKRLITDNTILAYEMSHFMKRTRSGKKAIWQ
jgi:hypothetical protein